MRKRVVQTRLKILFYFPQLRFCSLHFTMIGKKKKEKIRSKTQFDGKVLSNQLKSSTNQRYKQNSFYN